MDISGLVTKIDLPREIIVVLISSAPIVELRGAIPIAIGVFQFGVIKSYILAVIGNAIPIIPLLIFLEKFSFYLMNKYEFFNKIFTWWFERTRKHGDLVDRFESLGLMLFVAVPLPVTGAWTGCVAAYLFGIKKRYALPAIILGTMISGAIVSLVTLGAIKF